MSDLVEREYLLNIARKEEAYGYVSEHEILNAPNAETTGALDDAIQEYIKDGFILAEPNEYVKDGTLTVQMPTIKEAKAVDKIVVYADTYKQEYHKPKVGRWIKLDETETLNESYTCSQCGFRKWVSKVRFLCEPKPVLNFCPNCGAKMERSE